MKTFPQVLVAVGICFFGSSVYAQQGNPATRDAQPAQPTNSLAASGAGKLILTPTSLSFGNVVVGNYLQKQVSLSASNGSVTISSKTVSTAEFSISGISLPKTLASGQTIQISVRFKPNASGQASDKLVFYNGTGSVLGTETSGGTGIAAAAHQVGLSWQPDTHPVVGYNVYRGAQSNGPYSRINNALESTTNYTDSNVHGGTTYYYAATAVNSLGRESGYSLPLKVTIPSP